MKLRIFPPSSLPLAVLPFFPSRMHGGHRVFHPLLSLILIAALILLIYQAFRRKPGE